MRHGRVSQQPDIIISGGAVITMESATGIIEDGYVGISGSYITDVGEGPAPDENHSSVQVIDAQGMIVLPGFVNTHHHLWQTILRGQGADLAVGDWVNACVSKYGPKFLPEDSYVSSLLGLAEGIDSGITTVVNWAHNSNSREHVEASLRAMRESGVRGIYAFGARILSEGLHEMPYDVIDYALEHFFGEGDEMLIPWLAPPEPGFKCAEDFMFAVRFARERGLRLSIHLLESQDEIAGAPIQLLQKLKVLGPELLIAHAVHVNKHDIELLSATSTPIAHCPVANMRLASGIAPLRDMLARGITVGLGTDGVASNDSGDMLAVVKAALGLARATQLDPRALLPEDALYLATMGGARALGMDDVIGSICVGKKADLIIIDPSGLNFAPLNDCVAQLVLSGAPSNVDTVIADGHILKHQGRLQLPNVDALVRKSQRCADRIIRNKK